MNTPVAHKLLLAWYTKQGRVLPWREKLWQVRDFRLTSSSKKTVAAQLRDPYKVLVSELMLQQTQVERVLPKYQAFLQTWPTVHDLAHAELAEVLRAWQGLGYNRRAKFLWQTAQVIADRYQGVFPQTETDLVQLPGVGKYTARALQVFAFGQDVGVSDTNIQRIFARAWLGAEPKNSGLSSAQLWEVIEQSVPRGKSDPWHQALMDLGALVCTVRSPKCVQCPLQLLCQANKVAQARGFTSYTDELAIAPKTMLHKKLKFEETDRYFRGRIVDILREHSLPMLALRKRMAKDHGLDDISRFARIVESLVGEGLIAVRGSEVSLA